ncbi:MAG: thioredoxin domain-containing protein [Bacteroidales bacterium]|jgi:thiol-disulfide isomerase/thioredoxin|nr:thioredoxin domain-containing protein [Bacteroidota bacterium]
MNKLFLSVFPVILLAFTVSGCNSTSGNEGSNLAGDEKSSAKIEFLTKETFKQKVWDYEKNQQTWVYEGKLPAIIDFYADWCRPCRMVAPILDELAEDYKGKVVIYKINT